MNLSKGAAVSIGLGTLVGGVVVYEGLCRSPLGRNDNALAAALFVLLAVAAWGLVQVFSGRGAFIHFGAMIGTIMVTNVLHIIIPGERELVRAKQEGRAPDPKYAAAGKQRSVHNTYFTLPVVFTMISGHYAMTFAGRWSWLILVALTLAGALIRVWFVIRHKGPAPAWVLVAGIAFFALAMGLAAPKREADAQPVSFAEVKTII